jgi:UDP:flavonoid glycosyltransferase YjiC (YdhE family)
VAGTTEEKPEIAARVAWAGAGIRVKAKRPTADQVRDAVRRVLAEPSFRAGARRVAADYAGHDAPAEAVELIERLAATGRPVTRGADREVAGAVG